VFANYDPGGQSARSIRRAIQNALAFQINKELPGSPSSNRAQLTDADDLPPCFFYQFRTLGEHGGVRALAEATVAGTLAGRTEPAAQ